MANRNNGWPSPTGPTTPALTSPITDAEADAITDEQTAAASEHLGPADQRRFGVSTVRPGQATAPAALEDGSTPASTDRDVLARFVDIITATDGLKVRDVRPNRIATTRFTLSPGASVPLVGQELSRRVITIRMVSASPTDVVYLGSGPDAAGLGFPLYPGDNLEVQATDEMWIVANAANNAAGCTIATFREVLS